MAAQDKQIAAQSGKKVIKIISVRQKDSLDAFGQVVGTPDLVLIPARILKLHKLSPRARFVGTISRDKIFGPNKNRYQVLSFDELRSSHVTEVTNDGFTLCTRLVGQKIVGIVKRFGKHGYRVVVQRPGPIRIRTTICNYNARRFGIKEGDRIVARLDFVSWYFKTYQSKSFVKIAETTKKGRKSRRRDRRRPKTSRKAAPETGSHRVQCAHPPSPPPCGAPITLIVTDDAVELPTVSPPAQAPLVRTCMSAVVPRLRDIDEKEEQPAPEARPSLDATLKLLCQERVPEVWEVILPLLLDDVTSEDKLAMIEDPILFSYQVTMHYWGLFHVSPDKTRNATASHAVPTIQWCEFETTSSSPQVDTLAILDALTAPIQSRFPSLTFRFLNGFTLLLDSGRLIELAYDHAALHTELMELFDIHMALGGDSFVSSELKPVLISKVSAVRPNLAPRLVKILCESYLAPVLVHLIQNEDLLVFEVERVFTWFVNTPHPFVEAPIGNECELRCAVTCDVLGIPQLLKVSADMEKEYADCTHKWAHANVVSVFPSEEKFIKRAEPLG